MECRWSPRYKKESTPYYKDTGGAGSGWLFRTILRRNGGWDIMRRHAYHGTFSGGENVEGLVSNIGHGIEIIDLDAEGVGGIGALVLQPVVQLKFLTGIVGRNIAKYLASYGGSQVDVAVGGVHDTSAVIAKSSLIEEAAIPDTR